MQANSTSLQSKRDTTVDFAKGIAIIAIIWGHIYFDYPQSNAINFRALLFGLWHVSVFFIIAGFFIKEEQIVHPKLWFRKKFSSLYIKLLYLYIPAVLLHNFFIRIGWYSLLSTNPIIHSYSVLDYAKNILLTVFLAGREPIVGPLWFVYVLFMAMIGLSILSWILKRITDNDRKYQGLKLCALVLTTVIAGILSNRYNLTIRRFSNVFTAMLLIYVGQVLYQKIKLRYDNGWVAIACFLIAYEVSTMLGEVQLNANDFNDITQLIVASPCALYVIMYVGKRLQDSLCNRIIGYIGKNSFYIMGLHFAVLKLCANFLNLVGVGGGIPSAIGPHVGQNVFLFAYYLIPCIVLPILAIIIVRYLCKIVTNYLVIKK